MEENKSTSTASKPPIPPQEHSLTLVNRNHLTIVGVTKVVSVKPDLVQLKSNNGDMAITGQNIEVTKLDLEQHTLMLNGKFDGIKYIESNKTPLLKKIFK